MLLGGMIPKSWKHGTTDHDLSPHRRHSALARRRLTAKGARSLSPPPDQSLPAAAAFAAKEGQPAPLRQAQGKQGQQRQRGGLGDDGPVNVWPVDRMKAGGNISPVCNGLYRQRGKLASSQVCPQG